MIDFWQQALQSDRAQHYDEDRRQRQDLVRICEQMIQGSRLFSSTRLCTIISASPMPSSAPRKKPSNVAESVTAE